MKRKLLNIPIQADSRPTEIDVAESALNSWIDALPLMNYTRSCDQVTDALSHLNRHQLELSERIAVMKVLSSRVDEIHKLVPRHFDSDSFPLTEKRRASKIRSQKLLSECAIGHKVIITALIEDRALLSQNKKALFFSIVKSLHYMSLELVELFLSYRVPEKGTWQDLHKLYVIAEQMGVLDIVISGNAAQGEASTSINELYKKILLLSLADFSRLMNGEAEKVYQQLSEWAKLTSLSLPGDSFCEGTVVDLGIDSPASHVFSEKPLKFINGRVFEIYRLLEYLDGQIDILAEQGRKGGNVLSVRSRQAMYIRLRFTWGTRCERGAVREPIENPVKLISGLHDCHRGLSNDIHFNPEHDELRFTPSLDEDGGLSPGLSLVPEDDSPWMKDEMEARAASNMDGHRVSQFDDQKKSDAWEKIYANQVGSQAQQEREAPPLTVTDSVQVDTSSGGMAILCRCEQVEASLAVGKVVTLKDDGEDSEWKIGVVRWLVMLGSGDVRCGVQILSEDAETIATRSIKGVGENGEYYRSILIPEQGDHPASVLVPASVYSTNTTLSVVTSTEVKYMTLKELLNNSSSYNQFLFEVVSKPLTARDLGVKKDFDRRSF